MKCIIILIGLALVRFTQLHSKLDIAPTLQRYAEWMAQRVQLPSPWMMVALLLAAPVLAFLFVYQLLIQPFYSLMAVLLGALVLWLCLGHYKPQPEASFKDIFHQQNHQVFATIVWFILLGPAGALLYRLNDRCREASQASDVPAQENDEAVNALAPYAEHFQQLENWLDWPAVRLLTLGYALGGHFSRSFGFWLKEALSPQNEALFKLGALSLDLDPEQMDAIATEEQAAEALRLFDRSLIIYLVLVLAFTLGSWLY